MHGIKIEGRNAVLEMLRRAAPFTEICLDSNASADKRLEEIVSLAKQRGIRIRYVARQLLDKVSVTNVHMGVIAWAKTPSLPSTLRDLLKYCGRRGEVPFLVILDEIVYQQNLGAITRTANAAGVHGIIMPGKRGEGLTPEVMRISMGAAFFTPIIRESIYSALKMLKKEGVRIIGADIGGEKLYYEADLKGGVALVLGGEHKGLTEGIKERCDELVRVPMHGVVSSLNVSVTCGILIYEKLRQDMAARGG
jgi:23S rRNA (guanosine2251-2'-O)-methyltransferase